MTDVIKLVAGRTEDSRVGPFDGDAPLVEIDLEITLLDLFLPARIALYKRLLSVIVIVHTAGTLANRAKCATRVLISFNQSIFSNASRSHHRVLLLTHHRGHSRSKYQG